MPARCNQNHDKMYKDCNTTTLLGDNFGSLLCNCYRPNIEYGLGTSSCDRRFLSSSLFLRAAALYFLASAAAALPDAPPTSCSVRGVWAIICEKHSKVTCNINIQLSLTNTADCA